MSESNRAVRWRGNAGGTARAADAGASFGGAACGWPGARDRPHALARCGGVRGRRDAGCGRFWFRYGRVLRPILSAFRGWRRLPEGVSLAPARCLGFAPCCRLLQCSAGGDRRARSRGSPGQPPGRGPLSPPPTATEVSGDVAGGPVTPSPLPMTGGGWHGGTGVGISWVAYPFTERADRRKDQRQETKSQLSWLSSASQFSPILLLYTCQTNLRLQ